jgi:DNA invertase Pin-like site-specific DNA recombinase
MIWVWPSGERIASILPFSVLHKRSLCDETAEGAEPRTCGVRNPVAKSPAKATGLSDILMLLGYARVSKADDQDTATQVSALKAAGCGRVYEEKASGGRWDRPQVHRMLDHLRAGDIVVVWKLDRLSRSLKDLLHILEKIDTAGANFRSLTEAIDTSEPARRMMMQMLGSFAEFERAMVRERTRVGLKAAREQGRKGGRRSKLRPRQRAEIVAMLAAGRPGTEIARIFGVHRATISRIAAEARALSAKAEPVS